MDILSLQKALEKFDQDTIPKLEALLTRLETLLNRDANALLDRLSGTRLTIHIPPEGSTE